MKRREWIFVIIGLGFSLLLAAIVSPHASSAPDGLERVAHDKGFISAEEQGAPAWKHSPAPDYSVPGVASDSVSNGLAGLLGTAGVFLVATGLGLAIRKKRKEEKGARP